MSGLQEVSQSLKVEVANSEPTSHIWTADTFYLGNSGILAHRVFWCLFSIWNLLPNSQIRKFHTEIKVSGLVLRQQNIYLGTMGHRPTRQQLAGAEKPLVPLSGEAPPPGDPAAQPPSCSLYWHRAPTTIAFTALFVHLLWSQEGSHIFPCLYQKRKRENSRCFASTQMIMGKSVFLIIVPFNHFCLLLSGMRVIRQ